MVELDLSVSENLSKGLSQLNSLKVNREKARVLFNQWRERYDSKNMDLFEEIKNTGYQDKINSLVRDRFVLRGFVKKSFSFWKVLANVVSAIPLYYKTEVFYTSVTGRQFCISKRGLVVKVNKNSSKSSDLLVEDFAYLMVEYPLILKGLSSDNKFVKLKSLLSDLRIFFIDNHFLSVQNDFSIFKGNSSFVFNSFSKELFVFNANYLGELTYLLVYLNDSTSVKHSVDMSWYSRWRVVDDFNFLISVKDRLVELFGLDFGFIPVVSNDLVNDFFKKYLLFKSF